MNRDEAEKFLLELNLSSGPIFKEDNISFAPEFNSLVEAFAAFGEESRYKSRLKTLIALVDQNTELYGNSELSYIYIHLGSESYAVNLFIDRAEAKTFPLMSFYHRSSRHREIKEGLNIDIYHSIPRYLNLEKENAYSAIFIAFNDSPELVIRAENLKKKKIQESLPKDLTQEQQKNFLRAISFFYYECESFELEVKWSRKNDRICPRCAKSYHETITELQSQNHDHDISLIKEFIKRDHDPNDAAMFVFHGIESEDIINSYAEIPEEWLLSISDRGQDLSKLCACLN